MNEDPMGLPSTKRLYFPVTEHVWDLIDPLNYSGHLLQIYQDAGFLRPVNSRPPPHTSHDMF